MSEEQAAAVTGDEAQAGVPNRDSDRKRRRGWQKRLWLLPLVLIAGFFIWRAQQPRTVEVVHPQQRMVTQTLTASGRVEGAREVDLSADGTGVVVELLVAEGEEVAVGQPVARISAEVESAELARTEAAIETARAQVAEARASIAGLPPSIEQAEAEVEAAIAQARERIAAAEARLTELRAGGREEERREAEAAVVQAASKVAQAETEVERARQLAESDATARAGLERARAVANESSARLAEARARQAQAERDEARNRRLFEQGVIAQATYDDVRTAAETAAEGVRFAQAALRQAEVEVERQQRLLQVTREQELDRARAELETASAQLAQVRARQDLVQSPARQEQIEQQLAEVRAAQAALDAARDGGAARVRSLRLTPSQERVVVAQRRLDEALRARDAVLVRLEKTEIVARFAGIIVEVLGEAGDVIGPGQPILTMSEMDWPEVHVEIDEREIGAVRPGQDAVLIADAYPELTLEATVTQVAPRALTERGVIDVVLRPAERPRWLRTGMTIDASIIVEERRELLVLPTRAVVKSGQANHVLVVEDGEARRLAVRTGIGDIGGTVIRDGVDEHAVVILDPVAVRPGQRVRAVEAQWEDGAGNEL